MLNEKEIGLRHSVEPRTAHTFCVNELHFIAIVKYWRCVLREVRA